MTRTNVTTYKIFVGFASRDGQTDYETVISNEQLCKRLIDTYLGDIGASYLPSTGYFGGYTEPGAVIIVMAAADSTKARLAVESFAHAYKHHAEQLEVWVTKLEEKLEIF